MTPCVALDTEAEKREDGHMTATQALAQMFERKYDEARSNGATHEQAIIACRQLWLKAIGQ